MLEYTAGALPQYQVGRWTYGVPEIAHADLGAKLVIGSFCSIAPGVKILLGGEHNVNRVSTYPFDLLWEQAFKYKDHSYTRGDVIIGNDVWLGADSLILSGVTIGDGAVVGARSVVAQHVPPFAVVFGNPAKILRYRFSKSIIASLLEIAWWNWDDAKILEFMPSLLSHVASDFIQKAQAGAASPPLTPPAVIAAVSPPGLPHAASEEASARIAQSEQALETPGVNLAQRDAHVMALMSELAELRRSRSWRITAPVRFLGSACRKIVAKLISRRD